MKHLKSFKLHEGIYDDYEKLNIPELVTLATNNSNWSWDYDAVHIQAQILYNTDGTNELFLEIKTTHIKTGIGAGKKTRTLVFIDVGTIGKPQLKKVQELLSKHKYSSDRPFSRQWTDTRGNNLALGKLLRESRYAKLTTLKRNLEKNPKPTQEPVDSVKIMKYGRGYVVYGIGTKDIRDELKSIGARFNFRLKNPETGDKFAGWVISPRILDKAKELVGISQVQESLGVDFDEFYQMKREIQENFDEFELVRQFPKMYESFFEIIIDDSDLSYLKSEDPDSLEFDVAEACQIFFNDYLSKWDDLSLKFLQSYIKFKEFKISPSIYTFDKLSKNGKVIYDTLEQELDTVFWKLLYDNL